MRGIGAVRPGKSQGNVAGCSGIFTLHSETCNISMSFADSHAANISRCDRFHNPATATPFAIPGPARLRPKSRPTPRRTVKIIGLVWQIVAEAIGPGRLGALRGWACASAGRSRSGAFFLRPSKHQYQPPSTPKNHEGLARCCHRHWPTGIPKRPGGEIFSVEEMDTAPVAGLTTWIAVQVLLSGVWSAGGNSGQNWRQIDLVGRS